MGKRSKRGQSAGTPEKSNAVAPSDPVRADNTFPAHAAAQGLETDLTGEVPAPLFPKEGIYSISVAVLAQSATLMLSMYLLLIAPRLALTLLNPTNPETLVALRFIERIIELGVLLVIVRLFLTQVLGAASSTPETSTRVPLPRMSLSSVGVYFLIGLFIWITLLCPSGVIPFEIAWTAASPGGIGPALFMALPAGFVWYLHFFWAFTLPLPQLGLPERISLCRELVSRDPWAPIKTILGPSALQFLPTLLVLAPYPDGRSFELCLIADLLSGIQWLLCALVATGFGLHLLSQSEWSKISGGSTLTVPAFQKRAELTVQSSGILRSTAWLLRPRIGCQLLAICTLLWAANLGRLSNLPPAPTLSVTRVWLDEQHLMHVELEAKDPSFHFRGFRPLQLRVADSEGDTVLSTFPERAAINGSPDDVRVFFPVRSGPLSLQLVFRDQRVDTKPPTDADEAEASRAPTQWYLWYGAVKLTALHSPEDPASISPAPEPSDASNPRSDSAISSETSADGFARQS